MGRFATLEAPKSFGLRADKTEKGLGFFGELKVGGSLKDTDTIATEFSIGVSFDGKETQIPTLVPTLTQQEIDLMVNDIIPNQKSVPESITRKAIEHAKLRLNQGKSPFAQTGEQGNKPKTRFSDVGKTRFSQEALDAQEKRPGLLVRGLKKFGRSFVDVLAAIRTESEAGKGFTGLSVLLNRMNMAREAGLIPEDASFKDFLTLPESETEELFGGETFAEEEARRKIQRVQETFGFKATQVPEAETIPEKAVDIGAGVAGFVSKLVLVKRALGPAGGGRNLVAWETVNIAEGGTPGKGAAMYLALRGIDTVPVKGAKGFFVKTTSQSGLFAGIAAASGGNREEIITAAIIPWALRAFDAASKGTVKLSRTKLEARAVKNIRNISKDAGLDLKGVPDETLKFLIGRSRQARFWNKQFKKDRISEETLNKRLMDIDREIDPIRSAIARQQPVKPQPTDIVPVVPRPAAEKPTAVLPVEKVPVEAIEVPPKVVKPVVAAEVPAKAVPAKAAEAAEGKVIRKSVERIEKEARDGIITPQQAVDELLAKEKEIEADPKNRLPKGDFRIFTKAAERKLSEIGNAISRKLPLIKQARPAAEAVTEKQPEIITAKEKITDEFLFAERQDIKQVLTSKRTPQQIKRLNDIEDELVLRHASEFPEIDITAKTRTKEIKKVKDQIVEHPDYQAALEGIGDVPELGGTFNVDKTEIGDVKARFEGRPDILNKFKSVQLGGLRWDQAAKEIGIDTLDEFMDAVEIFVESEKTTKGGLNELALANALNAQDPSFQLFVTKREMLRNGFTAAEINEEIIEFAKLENIDLGFVNPELISLKELTDVEKKQAILKELDKEIKKVPKKKVILEPEQDALARARKIAFKTKQPVFVFKRQGRFITSKKQPTKGEFTKVTSAGRGELGGKEEKLRAGPTKEQIKEAKLLIQRINIEQRKKGLGKKAFSDLKLKHGGSRRLVGKRPRNIEQLKAILKAVKRARPTRIKNKIVVSLKTEKQITALRTALTDLGFMNDAEFQIILNKETRGLEPKFIEARSFITQQQARAVLARMHDTAQRLRVTEPIRRAVEKDIQIKREIEKITKLPRKAKDPSRLKSMRFFFQRLGDQANEPIYEVFLDLTLESQLRSRERHRPMKLVEKLPDFAKIANDPEALQRVEDWIVSQSLLKNRPDFPEDITDSEIRLAKLIQASFKSYEPLARAGKFFEFFDNRTELPQYLKFKQGIDKAFDIFNTEGYDALIKYLDTQEWGIVSAGYSPMESVVRKISTNRMPDIAVGKSRIRERGIVYRKQDRDILQRWYSYMRQMDQLVHIQPRIKSLVRLINDNQSSFVNPQRTSSVISTYLDNLKHTNYEDGLIEEWSRRLYSQAITVRVLADPLKPLRNLLQNIAFSEDRRDFLDPRNKKLTAEDLKYLETYVQQSTVMMTDWAFVGEDPVVFKRLTKWVQRKTLYPSSDRLNRLISFHAKINRVRRAFAKQQTLAAKMKDARFSDMQKNEQKTALGILAKDGIDEMARFIAKVHTDNTHFLYAREQRSPAEQTKLGRIALNLALFRRAALEKALLQLSKVFTKGTSFKTKLRAANVLVTLLGMSALVGVLWKKVTGQRYSPYSYFSFLELNFGGLEVAVIQKAEDVHNSMLAIFTIDPQERGKAIDRFGTDITKVADYMIPFYDIGLRAVEAVIGANNIDRIPARKLRQLIDKEYKSRGLIKINRSLVEKIQHTFAKGGRPAEETKKSDLFETRAKQQ